MRGLLDDEPLEGTSEARISYRPRRIAVPLSAPLSQNKFISTVRNQCQVWGGAVAPLVPLNTSGTVDSTYAHVLPGSAIDGIEGLHPFNLIHLSEATVEPSRQSQAHGPQLAFALLESGKVDEYRPVEVVELEAGDPWRMIYAACLGLLPERPNSDLLDSHNLIPETKYEDLIRVERVKTEGSLNDLLRRLNSRDAISPRKLSMLWLAYGNSGSTGIRTAKVTLPNPGFARFDAGPNVVVICSPDNIHDTALLWNLRGANGDSTPLPIGIPSSEVTPDLLRQLMHEPGLSRNGFPVNGLYVTSASLSKAEICTLIGEDISRVGIASYEEMLHLGYPGTLSRNEVLVWNKGETQFVPLPPDAHRSLFMHGVMSRTATMYADVCVLDSPFPEGPDVRASMLSAVFAAGEYSTNVAHSKRAEARNLSWPSSLLMARTVASRRGFELQESEPGRAARVLLAGLSSLSEIGNLAHAPLLQTLEEMAARQGFGWYKNRLRNIGLKADPIESVGPTTDELPEKTFNEFKKSLGNSDKATKSWLLWAEKSHLILKGFQLVCDACDAKQWLPVAGFAPPIVCRGCAREMPAPFGDRTNVEFRYRLSERLRRVYEQDAMGHLLVARYLYLILEAGRKGRLIGLHPGMEVREKGQVELEGEADVLLFTRRAEFIPVEVKRTFSGFTEREIGKLDHLASFLKSPWSLVASCQYGKDAGEEFEELSKYSAIEGYSRVVLSYDKLLGRPVWAINSDPFEWNPLSLDEIKKREQQFVRNLIDRVDNGRENWMAKELLNPPSRV
ncbi:hypothetical protein [Streptomyces ossamyceticus]|uniref:hypothetical protein n=1 Tax=Streptomyces ossamyceticus TaxID=249581 RepID=UPI001969BB89|nr:hypothetical protein [Streptomyces ossamyceticus]